MTRRPGDDETRSLGKGPRGGARPAVSDTTAPADPAAEDDDPRLPPQTLLGGRYQIIDLIGRGGMGAVYLAMDEALAGKPVALKVVRRAATGDADDAGLDQLRREVLLAQQVTHRNVCRIYDLERIEGRWMIKMEWVAGETLAVRVARGRLPIADAVAIARHIAHGLAAAHEQGVIHRDLKPGNVMIEEGTRRVVLMDFGIAQATSSAASSDQAGTPAFMAPEQARGDRLDARSDVYALGGVLYHMLIGEAAFPATSVDTAAGARAATSPLPPDPRSRRPKVPPWLGRAVQAMLARDPAQRPPDAAAVLRLLAGPGRRRARGLALAAAAAVTTVAVVAVVLLARPAPTRPAWQPAIRELEPAFDENVDSVAWSPDGSQLAFSSDRERPGWLRARVRRLRDGVETAVSPPEHNALFVSWTADGTGLLYTDISGGAATWQVPTAGGPPTRIGTGYAVACGAQLLRFEFSSPGCPNCPRFVLRAVDGGEREVLRLDRDAFVSTYRCDRAGARVVWSRAEQGAPFYQPADLWLADLATGAARPLTQDRRRNSYPTFTPDGKRVVFASARSGGVVNLWELTLDGGAARQLTFGDGNDLLPDVAPDGRTVAFTVDVTSAPLFAHGGGAGRERARVTPARVILIHPQATPDGREVIAADYAPLEPRIVAVAVADGTVRPLGDGALATVTPDGGRVIIASGGTAATLAVAPLAGGPPRPLATLAGRVRALRAGPDGVVHVMLDRGATLEAWRVPLEGAAPAREAAAPWCFVQPAPAGGWSLWIRCSADGPEAGVLVAPGATADPAAPGLRMDGQLFFGGDFDGAGRAYYVYQEPRLERVDVATGAITPLLEAAVFGATVSPDGATVYTTEAVGRSRRHLLTNFADRPRP